jgi:tellurite resistance protein
MAPIRLPPSSPASDFAVEIRGARVPLGPRGTYVSLSPSGFQYRDKDDGAPSPETIPQVSPEVVAQGLQHHAERLNWFKPYWISSLVFVLLLLIASDAWVALVFAVVLAGAAVPVRRWSEERRVARLFYDVDDPAAMVRFALASAAGEALAQCSSMWHVNHAIRTSDTRRNAGASTLLNRTPTRSLRRTLVGFETNLDPWSIPFGPQQLLFLPDRLLLFENGRVAAFAYEQLAATAEETTFVEEGPPPRDGDMVRWTWRFVCKDGTPDLRFRDNHQIPVFRYGEITISSPSGLRLVFQVSRTAAAFRAAHALNTLAEMARRAWAVHPPTVPAPARRAGRPAPTLVDAPMPTPQPPPPSPPSHRPAPATAPAARAPESTAAPAPVSPIVRPPEASIPAVAAPSPGKVPAPAAAGASASATLVMGWQVAPPPPVPQDRRFAEPALHVPARAEPARPALVAVPPAFEEPPAYIFRSSQVDPPTAGAWVPPGGSALVAGYELTGGMFYLGESLSPVSENRNVEPALINPRLLVDRAQVARDGSGMPYWPSYSGISSSQRAAYLEWMAGGRSAPDTYIGYVFLFLYGLERRILAEAPRMGLASRERDAIYTEVQRLLSIYGQNGSFRAYATEFLGVLWVGVDTRVYERCEPPTAPAGNDFPLLLQLGLGQLIRDGRPIPADWALAWVLCDPEARLPMPVKRCPEELRQLFRIRYQQAFGQGLVRKPGSKDLIVRYRPASASFVGPVILTARGVSDVTARKKPVEKLRELADQCASELEPFSRWIGRNPEKRGSVAAAALLPQEILVTHQGEQLVELCSVLDRHLEGNVAVLVPAAEILQEKRAKSDIVMFLQLLQKKGYGLEPDVRFGGELPSAEGKIVVFRIQDDAPVTASSHYRAVALLLHLAVAVAAADGEISEAEEKQIAGRVNAMADLSPAERSRLSAHVRWLAHEQPGIARVKKRVGTLDGAQRSAIADFIVAMAAADGRIDPGEVKLLTKLFPMLGLEVSEVYRRIHAFAGANISPAAGPVSVKAAVPSRGFAIPPPSTTPIEEGFVLDMASVQAKLAETTAVAALLGSIFVEEEQERASPSGNSPTSAAGNEPSSSGSASGPRVRSLDAAHSTFVRSLAPCASWSRSEVEALAAGLGLLTDGALETVNEAAFDSCGNALWMGDDPIEIDGDVMKELCA